MLDPRPIDEALTEAVAGGAAPGVAALVGDADGVVYAGAAGVREAGGAPMTADSVVWIASMTKPLTATAALRLVEQGRLHLDEPLEGVLPELAAVRVLAGFGPDGVPRLRLPRRPVTLRRLLTHTSGFGHHGFNADLARFHAWAGLPPLAECREATLLAAPLLFDPGGRWEYGTSLDWAGRAVERVVGASLEEDLRRHVFAPLGMADSGFLPGPAQRARLATVYRRGPDGWPHPTDFAMPRTPEFFMGGGGLYATAADYLRFARMLLRGGELDGARVLRPDTVAAMGTDQIAPLAVAPLRTGPPGAEVAVEFFPSVPKGWGFGGLVVAADVPGGRRAGSWGWSGSANTHFWVDPAAGIAAVFVSQVLPFGDERALAAAAAFERATYAALGG